MSRTLDRLFAAVGFLLGSALVIVLVSDAASGDRSALVPLLAGAALGALSVAGLVFGYRVALQAQLEALQRTGDVRVVQIALDDRAQRDVERLLPQLGFKPRNIALVFTRSELELWTGLRRPFRFLAVPLDEVRLLGVSGVRLELEVDRGPSGKLQLRISPRIVGRWLVRTPSVTRMRDLENRLLSSGRLTHGRA